MDKDEFFANARDDRSGPIDGLRVLDCTTTWAGPMCGCVLADLGADVIRVEIPTGDVLRITPPDIPGTTRPFAHETVNRNKRGLTLDLHRREAVQIFLDLAATCDVVVENFLPGTLARWGVGYEHVKAVKPDIVYVSISGWGQFGPWHTRPGYDPLAQAASGFFSLNGSPDGPVGKSPTWLGDDLAGLHGTIGALAALRHRDATGEGQHVDVGLLDALLFQSNGFLTLGATGSPLERWGAEIQFTVPFNAYECTDGKLVCTGVILATHWARLCDLMGRPDLVDEPGWRTNAERCENRKAVDETVGDWARGHTSSELIAKLTEAGLPVSPVRTYAEAATTDHVTARGTLQTVTLCDGNEAPITAPPVKFSRTPTRARFPAPDLGEHTAEVLAEIGIGTDRCEQLRLEGIV